MEAQRRPAQAQEMTLFSNPARIRYPEQAMPHASVQVLSAPAGTDGPARLAWPTGLPASVYLVGSGEKVRRLTVE